MFAQRRWSAQDPDVKSNMKKNAFDTLGLAYREFFCMLNPFLA